MTKSRGINKPRTFWTEKQINLLHRLYPDNRTEDIAPQIGRPVRSVYQKARELGIKKSAEFLASGKAGRLDGVRGGATRFKKGQVPPNKGLRRPGWSPGRMSETQFKPGERRGVAVKLYQPIGTERISKDGYLERKINDDMPPQRRWRAVHLVVWEEANGALPPGHAVAFKDGNKKNISLDNLELISRAELMRRNTYHRYGKEIASLVQLRGALTRQINKRAKQHEQ